MPLLFLFLIGSFFLINNNGKELKEVYDETKLKEYHSLSEIEEEAELICLVSKVNVESDAVLTIGTVDSVSGYTPTDVVIKKIWKGNKEVGDVITIAEQFFVDRERYELHRIAGYQELKSDYDYILFLAHSNDNDPNLFYSLGVLYGQVSLVEQEQIYKKCFEFQTNKSMKMEM